MSNYPTFFTLSSRWCDLHVPVCLNSKRNLTKVLIVFPFAPSFTDKPTTLCLNRFWHCTTGAALVCIMYRSCCRCPSAAVAAADEQSIKYDILFDTSRIRGNGWMYWFGQTAQFRGLGPCCRSLLSRPFVPSIIRHLLSRFDSNGLDPHNFKLGQRDRVVLFRTSLFWCLFAFVITKLHRIYSTDSLLDLEALDSQAQSYRQRYQLFLKL